MRFLSSYYSTQVEIWEDDSYLGYTSEPIYGLAKRPTLFQVQIAKNLLFCDQLIFD